MAGKITPQKSSTIIQDGSLSAWSINPADFDFLARPLKIRRSGNVTRTESIEYHDDRARWVIGKIKKRICQSSTTPGGTCSGTVMQETTFNSSTSLPLTHSTFGQLQQRLAWNPDGTLQSISDARGNTTRFEQWYRGVPLRVIQPDGSMRSATANPRGEITSVTDEMGYTTQYGYDSMGRITSITRPGGDSTNWLPTQRSFTQVASSEFGIQPGHWRLTETTGNYSQDTYYDALWRPILIRERDVQDSTSTRFIARRFDLKGREVFKSYPGNSHLLPQGIFTTYDALDRVTSIQQDSELGRLSTHVAYLSDFRARMTDPRGNTTTITYQNFDQRSHENPIHLEEPAG